MRTIHASSPAAASPWSFVRPYAPSGLGASDSRYGVALRAVEDVVARVVRRAGAPSAAACCVPPTFTAAASCGSSSAPSTFVHAAACSTSSGRSPGGGGKADVPPLAGERGRERQLPGKCLPELPAGARDQDAAPLSRSERSGDRVLQRSTTRGSFHAIPFSSGFAASYSSVTR